MKLFRVKNWATTYENAKSRTIKQKSWCALRNKQDGLGYGRLLRLQNGPSLYGAFISVVLVASKQECPREGYLTDTGRIDGIPYDSTALSIKTQMPQELIQQMLDATSQPTIDWIEIVGSIPEVPSPGIPAIPAVSPKKEGVEGEEGGKEGAPAHSSEVAIPSLKEVVTYGTMHGVPEEYGQYYFDKRTEGHRWIVPTPTGDKLLVWSSEILRWWKGDRHKPQWTTPTPKAPVKPSIRDIA